MNCYKDAGVDVNAGYELVRRIKGAVASTKRPGYVGNIGGFGGLFDLDSLGYDHPVLVSGTDGVGTKLMIAQKMDKNDTVGIDVVAMCVNDVLAQGAEPLFFLDYIACGHNDPALLASVVQGVAEGCKQAGASLIGGETAEMPDMYAPDEYDLAGFTVGVAEKDRLLSVDTPQAGDVLLGLASSGVHSNGFSLVRKILFKDHDVKLTDKPAELKGKSVGESLLAATRIYIKSVLPLIKQGLVHGVAHITGGGLIENVPRMFNDDLRAEIAAGSWEVPDIFSYLKQVGNLSDDDCWQTFNMGLGMILAVPADKKEEAKQLLLASSEKVFEVGHLSERTDGEKIIIK
ncbi:phosphoribosylformylglycinamidine cyclo-ligase [Lactobacillus delbrueckii]|uniref:phosphoribosylformylglycinamidine cyclo-ligase n=1 Tax=Lactobacillus delbrueckii TaxID=1584 RepID=UPI001F31F19E|nr:phosphoribosylformylglycinamidine cyclo-ligase [Lactobacillus delbrueckii]